MSVVVYRTQTGTYRGVSAVDVVLAIERDAYDYPEHGGPLSQFLQWSLARLADRIPTRDLELSTRLNDETLALWYLSLCDQYGLGSLSVSGRDAEMSN